MAAQRGNFDLPDVDAVDQDLTLLELVVAADEGQDRALAGAGRANEGRRLAGVNVEGDALQHPLAGDIAEPDVAELDLALHLVQLDGIGGIHHLRLQVHDEKTFSDEASADCSQLNCSARFWMGVKNLEMYI